MRTSIFVAAALLASSEAVKLYDGEEMNLQLGVEARARANVRQQLSAELHAYLDRGSERVNENGGYYNESPLDNRYPEYILPNSVPVVPADLPASSDMDVAFVQLHDDEGDLPSVEQARLQAAQMQAQMDQAIAEADQKRAEQQAQYDANIQNDDPAGQLQGLMNAQQSLHRLTSAFSAKPAEEKVADMAAQLGIPMTPELMQLGTNEAISNALVEIAVGMGKSEEEISAALG